ncbi:MAG: ATP-binding protein [Bacteroidota bacterium]
MLDKFFLFLNHQTSDSISEPDRQRVILTGLGAIIVIVACLFLAVVELLIGKIVLIPFYGIITLCALSSLIFLRRGNFNVAKIILVVPVLLVIALLASIERQEKGVYLYFIAASVYVITIFGYKRIISSLLFFLLTVTLAFVSYFYKIDILNSEELTQVYIDTSYLTNFLVSLFASLAATYFLMRLNIKSNVHLVKTSKELRESENKFQLAIQGSSAGIWEWNGADDLIRISPKLADLFGYDLRDFPRLTMQGMLSFIHPDDLEDVKEKLLDHFKKKTPFSVECRAKTKAGNYIWVLDTGQAEWDSEGRAIKMVGTLLDIDERKRAETQIQKQNELLAKTNEELDRFVYSTSHDLKAPLSSVQGLIAIAELTDNKEELKECLNLMKGRISNLNAFIADITNYSRNSRLGLSIEEVDLKDLLDEVFDDLEYFKGRADISFEMDFPKSFSVSTDWKRLKVILGNLLNNAVKYHNYDLENPIVQVKASHEESEDMIQVIDNGQGIASEHHSNIFDMFYRATERSDGSGLGLYIVKETVDKLQGSITLQSEVGAGSVFTLKLPKP